MNFLDFLAPLTLDEFKTKVFNKRSIAVTRDSNPYPDLLTLSEIELRLNDGSATLASLAVVGQDGAKLPRDIIYNQREELRWSPISMKKRFVLDKLLNHHSFVMHNMTQINRNISDIADSIEDEFPGFHTDLHIYISPRPSSTGYNVHRDSPQHKIFIQLIGKTHWTIYKKNNETMALPMSMPVSDAEKVLEVDFRSVLTPGSALYMPPDTYHHVVNGDGPRVSLSFPFTYDPAKVRMDRTHIPFKRIFESSDDIDQSTENDTQPISAQGNV